MHVHVRNKYLPLPASILVSPEVLQQVRSDQMMRRLLRVMLGFVTGPGHRSARPMTASSDLHDAVAARASPETIDRGRFVSDSWGGNRTCQKEKAEGQKFHKALQPRGLGSPVLGQR